MKKSPLLSFGSLPGTVCILTLIPGIAGTSPASEWDEIKAQYGLCEVIGGKGQANGDNNPNEWNAAEGKPAASAELSEPHSAMADIYGRVYVADKNAHAIRRIDPDGTIHTVAGMNMEDLPAGDDTNAGDGADGPARKCKLDGPQHAYVLPDGTFYIMDTGNHRVRRVDPDGKATKIINDPDGMNRGLWVQRQGSLIYYCTNTALKRWSPGLGNNPGKLVAKGFGEASNIDVDRLGNIYVTDRGKSVVYRVPFNHNGGDVTPGMIVAGTGANEDSSRSESGDSAKSVGLLEVRGIAFHPLGGYFLATHAGGDIWYVDSDGEAHLFIRGNSANAHNPNPFPVPADDENEISEPRSVSLALNGDLLIATNDAGFIRRVRTTLPSPAPPRLLALTEQTIFNIFKVPTRRTIKLTWESESPEWYLVDRSTSMAANSWSGQAILPATGEETRYTIDIGPLDAGTGTPTVPREYYRLHSLRSWPN